MKEKRTVNYCIEEILLAITKLSKIDRDLILTYYKIPELMEIMESEESLAEVLEACSLFAHKYMLINTLLIKLSETLHGSINKSSVKGNNGGRIETLGPYEKDKMYAYMKENNLIK